jgi:hypothetical protein
MLTDAERRDWLDDALRSHPLCKPVTPNPPPDLTVSNVAYREARKAWLAGLYVSTVLCSYAACEITLAFRYAVALTMMPDESIVEWDDAARRMAEADDEIKDLSVGSLIKNLRSSGQPIGGVLSDNLRKLGGHRNDLAHYRPVVRGSKLISRTDGSFLARFEQAEVVKPQTQERYAMHGMGTMFDLWSAPVTNGLNLGNG